MSRLLVISGRQDERSRNFLRAAPIDGFFDWASEEVESLSNAIRRVGNGGRYFSATFNPGSSRAGSVVPLSVLLTPTELQVFAVIGDGSDDRRAADRLNLSAKTILTHRQRIMRKLGVQTRSEMMLQAMRRGMVRVTEQAVLRPGFEGTLAAGANDLSRQSEALAPAQA
ncbi:MAG: LuxR C-terminal-related transcriptional regulator [Opitutaceae bacterium]